MSNFLNGIILILVGVGSYVYLGQMNGFTLIISLIGLGTVFGFIDLDNYEYSLGSIIKFVLLIIVAYFVFIIGTTFLFGMAG